MNCLLFVLFFENYDFMHVCKCANLQKKKKKKNPKKFGF